MAVVWQRQEDGVLYQVHRRGDRMRLFANGVQHSEFHPRRLVTGSVWDLLWLPALLSEPERFRRVLILGLGGGTLLPPYETRDTLWRLEEAMTATAPSTVICLGDSFDDLAAGEGALTVLGDAVAWLNAYDGEPFDLIIEDLFAPDNDVVSRAVPADRSWVRTLARHVSERGTLVMNFGDFTEYRQSHAADQLTMKGWSSRFRLSCGDCHNAVVAFTREPARSVHLRRRLQQDTRLAPLLRRGRLDYHIRQLD